ncbi:uncharacterized protein [Temnothorax nylanderi]|uniref:uncharacterized protein n=1 Tax=Temnothorax nylanderi TaxID=102681 RepID=UPI003A897488
MLKYNICKISIGDFRIVPIGWFSENNEKFKWPSYENINEVNAAIYNVQEPESDWDEINVDKILMSKGLVKIHNKLKKSKKVKRVSHDTLLLKPANFQSVLKCTKTTNKSLGEIIS